MTTVEILTEARALVARGWTRGAYSVHVPDEVPRFCVQGAIWEAMKHEIHTVAVRYFEAAIDGAMVTAWNDAQPSVEPVLAAFDRAIAIAMAS